MSGRTNIEDGELFSTRCSVSRDRNEAFLMTWKGFLTFSALARRFSSPELSCYWNIFWGKNSASFTSCSHYPSSCAQKFQGISAGKTFAHEFASSSLPSLPAISSR